MGGQKEMQVVALNKTETQYTYHCFPPELSGGGGGGERRRGYPGN